MQKEATSRRVQKRQDTPQVLTSLEESLNSKSLNYQSNDGSIPSIQLVCGCNHRKHNLSVGSMSTKKHEVFVLGVDGKPLTPTTNAKARKLLKGTQAKPIWNKFGKFGSQMLKETRKSVPKTVLGVDFGTKFEEHSIVTGKENNL
ncbi:MAG: RRXRR domain-containing protein, partial [Candidatus Pacebacteria bacterium]|nr:RRXRR domain-containing protein [Candidatus Paceibacterota bacterium]